MGFDLPSMESWGTSLQLNGPPSDRRRIAELRGGSIDTVFDEGIRGWLPTALDNSMQVLELESDILAQLRLLGWRTATLPRERFSQLDHDVQVIDYSGWPLYTRASLADDVAYRVCEAISQRAAEIPWEDGTFHGAHLLGDDAEVTPLNVPLHPGHRPSEHRSEHGLERGAGYQDDVRIRRALAGADNCSGGGA
jgi:hypothetical protein